jgi:hypothetical protein
MKTLLTVISLLAGLALTAQSSTLSGKITDAQSGEPVAFATIYCQSCAYGGTISNAAGDFELEDAQTGDTIRIFHLMYARSSAVVATTRGALVLKLIPIPLELPTVEINAAEVMNLLARAYERLASREDEFYEGEVFYRQLGKVDTTHAELMEAFATVTLNNRQTRNWALQTGRYAVHPAMRGLVYRNFSAISRDWNAYLVEPPKPDKKELSHPLCLAALGEYDYGVSQVIERPEGRVLVIEARANDRVQGFPLNGKIYLEEATARLLKTELFMDATGGLALSGEIKLNKADLFVTAEYTLETSGNTVPKYVTAIQDINFTSGERSINWKINSLMLFFDLKATDKKGGKTSKKFRDRKMISKQAYDPSWWARHPAVATTPLEREVIEAFTREGTLGNFEE